MPRPRFSRGPNYGLSVVDGSISRSFRITTGTGTVGIAAATFALAGAAHGADGYTDYGVERTSVEASTIGVSGVPADTSAEVGEDQSLESLSSGAPGAGLPSWLWDSKSDLPYKRCR